MYGYDILCGIAKGTFEILHKILPIHWKIRFLYKVENLRARRFMSSYVSMN